MSKNTQKYITKVTKKSINVMTNVT